MATLAKKIATTTTTTTTTTVGVSQVDAISAKHPNIAEIDESGRAIIDLLLERNDSITNIAKRLSYEETLVDSYIKFKEEEKRSTEHKTVKMGNNEKDPWGFAINYDDNWSDWKISEIHEGNQADNKGLKQGDKIIAVNNERINGKNFNTIKDKYLIPGIECQLTITRQKDPSLIEAELERNKIVDASVTDIVNNLRKDPTVEKLDLSEKKINDDGAVEIAKELSNIEKLTEFSLCDNTIGDIGAKEIGEALKKNKNLKKFSLQKNKISNLGAIAIASSLEMYSSLSTLSLNDNKIGDDGAKAIGAVLMKSSSLTQLSLAQNQIGNDGANALADGWEANTILRSLNLMNNSIGGIGTTAILKKTKMSQARNIFTDMFTLYGGHRLKITTKDMVERVKLNTKQEKPGYTRITVRDIADEFMKMLSFQIENNNIPRILDASNCDIDDKYATLIGESLKNNVVLTELGLGWNKIGNMGAKALGTALKNNKHLEILKLYQNEIYDEGAIAIAGGLNGYNVKDEIYDIKSKYMDKCTPGDWVKGYKPLEKVPGVRVLAHWKDESGIRKEYPGKIHEKNNDGTYFIQFDNGKKRESCPTDELSISLVETYAKIVDDCGDNLKLQTVEKQVIESPKNVTNGRTYRRGEVISTSQESTYTILFEDEKEVKRKNNLVLNNLVLNGNNIGDNGAKALAKALEKNETLQIIFLSYNKMSAKGIDALNKVKKNRKSKTYYGSSWPEQL